MYKTPSEKDFFGQPCLTPDCDGELIKIEVHDECGNVKTLQGDKLKDKVEDEGKKQKDRLKRELEKKAKPIRKFGKQQQKKSEIERLPVGSSPSPKVEAVQSATKPCLDLSTFPVRFQHSLLELLTQSVVTLDLQL